MFVFQTESASVVFEAAKFLPPELALAPIFATLLFRDGGNTDGGQFIFVAVEATRKTRTEFAGVEAVVLPAAFRVQTRGSDDQGMCSGGHEFAVQRVAKTAALVYGVHGLASRDSFFAPGDELRASQLLGGLDRAMVALNGDDAEVQINVDAELEHMFDLIRSQCACGIALADGSVSVWTVVMGCYLCDHKHQECEPVLLALVNPSWHLTRHSVPGLPRVRGSSCVFRPRGSALERRACAYDWTGKTNSKGFRSMSKMRFHGATERPFNCGRARRSGHVRH
jgi:hypothetical protein